MAAIIIAIAVLGIILYYRYRVMPPPQAARPPELTEEELESALTAPVTNPDPRIDPELIKKLSASQK